VKSRDISDTESSSVPPWRWTETLFQDESWGAWEKDAKRARFDLL